jgi:hypothetical protein
MSAWIATALTGAISAISAITTVNAGSCAPGNTQNCFNMLGRLDFSSVPVISQQIVSEEKTDLKQNSPQQSRRRRLPTRAQFSGQVRGQDERRLSAIPGHWSDGSVSPRSAAQRLRDTWTRVEAGFVTRSLGLSLFIKGATMCPTAFVAPISTY